MRGPLVLATLVVVGCGSGEVQREPARTPVAAPLADSVFIRLVDALSEPGGYFDTDNLISNEASYLHVVSSLRGREGGAYLGVGPGQNFSYLAALRPQLAFLVDIRRDNLLQHLWFKTLFEAADSRLDYLCILTARSCGGPSFGLDVNALVARVDEAAPVDTVDALIAGVVEAAGAALPLSEDDRAFLASVHRRFASAGLDLRFNSHGRAPLPSYPTLRRLVLEVDRQGEPASFLAREEDYAFVDALQEANRVIPVVGDLAGGHAIRAIGRELDRRGLTLSAVYTSNVEFYLFADGTFSRWVANLEALPVTDASLIIRSYFNRWAPHPETLPGYASTQLLQRIPALLAVWEDGRVRDYEALVSLRSP